MNYRPRVGLTLLTVSICCSMAWQLGRVAVSPGPTERHPAVVAEYDARRFAGLTASLPSGGTIGYMEDEPEDKEISRLYYLAQYALAPCVLAEDDRLPLVLVNGRPERELRPPGVRRLLRDLGNGVRLFGEGRQ